MPTRTKEKYENNKRTYVRDWITCLYVKKKGIYYEICVDRMKG